MQSVLRTVNLQQRWHKNVTQENVPAVFFNMQPMDETMEEYDNIWYVGAEASESRYYVCTGTDQLLE